MKYVLAYNGFRNLESIGIDGKAGKLIKYSYKNDSGRLKQITYANGDAMKATYNSVGQMVAEKWYNAANTLTAHYKYVYDGQGNIVRSLDILAGIEYNYTYENGRIVRAAESSIILSGEIVTAKDLVSSILYSYDSEGKLTKKRIIPVDGAEQVVYYETNDDNTVVKFSAGGRTVTSHSKTDSFGRKIFDELQLETGFVSRQFHYHSGDVTDEHVANEKLKSSATTQLVSQIVLSGGRTISYEYDAEEHITKVTDSVDGITEYTYDALGQLLTEKKNGTVVNTMEYDNYGNILSKNGTVYTYGTSAWKDLLTGFGDQSISYDAQGNPTSYLGHTLTWEKGRQLKSFDNNTYTYNANGIRTSKTVNGVKHTYTLDGTKILRETWGSNTLIPLYDNEDSVCGIIYNNEPFYLQKNLQGDVVAVIGKDARVVATYSYDAWGVCTVTSDTSAVGIATVNPFRYRGYYYDSEIGMYYLQSRYYDAGVGRFVNADTAEMIKIQIESVFVIFNLLAYCYNDSVNNTDETGFGGADALLNAVRTAFDIIIGANDIAEAMMSTAKDIKKIRKATGKSKKQIEREIASVKKSSKKLAKGFKIVGILLTVMSIIMLIYSCVSNAPSIVRAVTDFVVEMFISLLIWGVSKVVGILLKLVPVPGVAFVLGFAAGYVIEGIFSSWFNDKKKKRMQNSFYSRSAILIKQKSTDIKKYVECFFKCLGA